MINIVYGSGATIGDAALASPELAGIHFTGSTPVFQSMWKTVGDTIASYRNYPRIVGETAARTSSSPTPPPTSTRSRPRSCVARSSTRARSARPPRACTRRRACGPSCASGSRPRSPSSAWATSRTSPTSWGRHRQRLLQDAEGGDRRGARRTGRDRRRRRLRRQRGLLRRADGDPDRGSGYRTMSEELFGPVVTTYVYDDKRWSDTLDLVDSTARTGSRARSSPTTASPSRRSAPEAPLRGRPSTSATSRPAPSSGSSRSAAPARPARTTRRARCGT